jgi:glycosyltransferase involved in cell wall biosynthesis
MKIIALVPVKNEAWILPTFLSSVKPISDKIIALDDNSTDESKKILEQNNVLVLPFKQKQNIQSPMSERRKILLEEGRKQKGTHFIWLDADEAFTNPFIKNSKNIIQAMKPGQKLVMQWLALWKNTSYYKNDSSVWSNNYKDFIFCDHPEYDFEQKFLSEARTPESTIPSDNIKININQGAVLHFQFVFWQGFQIKQAWYRCLELIKKPQNAFNINQTYKITLDDKKTKLSKMPDNWVKGIKMPLSESKIKTLSLLKEISARFNQYGILFFEPLQIWHVPELYNEFVKIIGRKPRPILKPDLHIRVKTQISKLIPRKIKNQIKNLIQR